eukprot:160998-Prymnesium_polylepis.1
MPTGHTASIAKAERRVAPRRSRVIIREGLAQEGPEDPCRRARQHQEGEAERWRQHPLQSGVDRGADALTSCRATTALLAPPSQEFGANEAQRTSDDENKGPGRPDPDARAVVAQAGGGHQEDALNLGRQLEKVDPRGILL